MTASPVQLIGGSFQDSEGNLLENGYLEMELSQDCTVTGVGNVCSGIKIRIQLDSAGNAASSSSTPPAPDQYIWGNDVLLPPNNFYRVTGFTAAGQPAWGPNNQQVTGSTPFNLGSWVPNQIISWVPPLQPLALEVNGTPNEDQSLLNLTNGNNVTITDDGSGEIVIAASGGASFDTAGQGGFWSAGIDLSAVAYAPSVAGFVGATANQITVWQFTLNYAITISKASCYIEESSSGQTVSAGIYTAAGTLVGYATLSQASTGLQSVSFTPFTLQPGTYFFAQSQSFATLTVVAFGQGGEYTPFEAMVNANHVRIAQASNVTISGAMPATLGTLTADSIQPYMMAVFFEP
jgi:hypothetical protein